MHFNGQSTISLDGAHATGETYCLAHHLFESHDGRELILMSIRYDTFMKKDGSWQFAERRLIIDWTDKRPSVP